MIFSKQELKKGDVIIYEEEPYIIFFPEERKKHSYVGRARKCNHRIAFNFSGNVQWFDTIIQAKTFDTNSGTFITLPEGKIEVWLQENEISVNINLQQRFLNTNQAWQGTGMDRTQKGLVRLFCELTARNADDNFGLGIADYNKYSHVYSIAFSNPQPMGITVGNTIQLSVVVKDNGVSVSPIPAITYVTSNPEVARVTESGLVTGIGEGTVAITATLTENTEVSTTAEVRIAKDTPKPASYSIMITYKSTASIKVGGNSKTITAKVYSDDVAVGDKAVDWTLRNQDGSSEAKVVISEVTDTTCKLQAVNNIKNIGSSVILKATLREDSTVYREQEFKLDTLV